MQRISSLEINCQYLKKEQQNLTLISCLQILNYSHMYLHTPTYANKNCAATQKLKKCSYANTSVKTKMIKTVAYCTVAVVWRVHCVQQCFGV